MSGLPVIRTRYRARTARVNSLSAVYLLLPVALAIFLAARIRSSILGIVPRGRTPAAPRAAFVCLSPEQSEAAMARVRTSWQLERGGPVSVEFDPAVAAFESAVRPAGPVPVRRPRMSPSSFRAGIAESSGTRPLAPPSMAAAPPENLAADCAPLSAEGLFPRDELLKFDGLAPSKKGTAK